MLLNQALPFKISLLALTVASSSLIATTTFAAEKEESVKNEVERIVVTSRKRIETLQQIPDSVTVFNHELIESAGIESIKDFSALTPNLNVSSNFRSGLNFVTVRGLITPQVGEAPIAYVVDGITVPSLDFINQGLHDIDRIEVLRGPQGAIYGKNAIGGAVNIITKRPTDEIEGSVKASYAEGNEKKLNAVVSGPIIDDKVYFRLSTHYKDKDGLITNDYLNKEVDFVDGAYGFQGMLEINLTDDTRVSIFSNFSDVAQGSNYQDFITKDELEDFSITPDSNVLGRDESKLWSLSAKVETELDDANLTIILSRNSVDTKFFSDGDFTNQDASEDNFYFPVIQNNPITEDSTNIEVRYSVDNGDDFHWQAGLYLEEKDRNVDYDQILDLAPTSLMTYESFKRGENVGDTFTGERTVQNSKSYALFGQMGYDLTQDVELTVALRYDSEKRDTYDARDQAASQIDDTYSQFQPKASVAWQMTDDVLSYLTYSKGFRSGGFNEYSSEVIRSYDKEVSDTFETGLKTTWLDGRVWLNMALFRIDQQDAQFTRLNPNTFTLENLNIDKVAINGAELEMSAKVSDNITLSFGAGLIDNEITKNVGIDASTGRDLNDSVGDSMPYVSKFNLNGAINHSTQINDTLSLKSRLSFNTQGPRSFDLFKDTTGNTKTHTFVDANVSLENEQWTVSLFASNLTDERTAETVFVFNPLIRFANQPRQIGISTKYRF